MTMSLLSHDLLFTSAILVTLLNLLLPGSCSDKWSALAPQGMLMEDKIRLGSTPPSCHNRCNACNPCTAVQVPTLPSRHDHAGLGPVGARPLDDESSYNKYSNYKPLGWKCQCDHRLFNP